MRIATAKDFIEIEERLKSLRDHTYGEVKPEINEALLHIERAKYIIIEIEAARERRRV